MNYIRRPAGYVVETHREAMISTTKNILQQFESGLRVVEAHSQTQY